MKSIEEQADLTSKVILLITIVVSLIVGFLLA